MAEFSKFKSFSKVEQTRKTYRLDEPFCWSIGLNSGSHKTVLDPGATFDISVPRWLEWFQSPHDKTILPAALIHDVLLRKGYTPDFAAAEFRRALIMRGVSRRYARLLFAVVLVWTALR